MTATKSNRPAMPMRLRICDGDGERIVPASVTAVELVFEHAGPLRRSEALRQFRQFVLTALPETAGQNERVSP